MNVMQVLPSLDVGGVETGTVDLAGYLAARGHKVIVVSGGGRLVRRLDMPGVRHYTLPVGEKSPLTVLGMIGRLVNIIRSEDIDIVHARSRVPALTAFFAARLTRRIFITTAHGYYRKHLLSEPMGWSRYVIVASNIMAKHMISSFGVPYERIRLIPRGVDLERFPFRPPRPRGTSEFTIGMVSRITPLKGHSDFIKAVSILNRRIPRLKALIVGTAPKEKYKEDLELLIRRLGLHRTVEFLGPREDIPAVMNQLDVLVSATVTPEAFGRAIIEAQASGVPVVATRVGGVVDIIEDNKTGLLCPAFDPKEMADRIMRLYEDKELAERIAAQARRRVEADFNLEKMMTRTLAVYEEGMKSLNILVIKMSALGDVILSVPSLRAIRAKFPGADIKVLVGVQSREALDRCPYINECVVCDLDGRDRGFKGLLRLGRELRKKYFDIVIDLQNNRRSHMLAFLTLALSRYGYKKGRFSFLLNRRVDDDAPYLDPVEHQFRTLALAGIKAASKELELWPSEADAKRADELLEEGWVKDRQGLVGINIRASSRWLTKNWPASHIAELCDRLAREFNIRVVLTGAKGDLEHAVEIARLTKSKPVIAAGKTDVMELAALIKRFRVYLTPDSAPMHIAAAVKTPFVALFGPTDPARHLGPAKDHVVLMKDLKCAPCYSPYCTKGFRCMRTITVDEVLAAMRPYLVSGAAAEEAARQEKRMAA